MIFSSFRTRRAICRFLTAGMFFAQAIGIANACIEAAPSPAMAFTQNDHDGDCGKTVNQNACLQQCNAEDQSTAQAQVEVAAMPAIAVLSVPVAPTAVPARPLRWCLLRILTILPPRSAFVVSSFSPRKH